MSSRDFVRSLPQRDGLASRRLVKIHLDPLLLAALLAVIALGLVVLYSAVEKNSQVFAAQAMRLGFALTVLVAAAQFDPRLYQRWSAALFAVGVALLIAVLVEGEIAKGAQRWLDLPGLPRFQPSEILKIAVPLLVASYFNDRPLPPSLGHLVGALTLIAVPAALIAVQPDLGTAILVTAAGLAVVVLSGVYWRWIGLVGLAALMAAPGLWYVMHDYQRERVLTLFDPERDPLGSGWNIIQSTTAIGSGGVFGKGLFQGTQSHLEFLPESQTDFIIAVVAGGARSRRCRDASDALSRDRGALPVHCDTSADHVRASVCRWGRAHLLCVCIC